MAGLDPGMLERPEGAISFQDLGRLVRHCVRATRCSHFGLLVGQRCSLATLGPLGSLASEAPDVGSALQDLARYLHVFNRAISVSLSTDGDLATLSYGIVAGGVPASDQITDACVAVLFNTMRSLCGVRWSPIAVMLPHRAPVETQPFRTFFRTTLDFDAPDAAVSFPVEWLTRPIAGSSALRRRSVMERVSAIAAGSHCSLGEVVGREVRAKLANGRLGEGDVAARLAMDVSTLRRRLDREGKSFREIAEAIRFETAKYFLVDSRLNLAAIADAVGYSEHSAFTRAFRKWSGISPRDWRQANAAGAALGSAQ